MLRKFDRFKRRDTEKMNTVINYCKIDGFRKLKNSNGDDWYLPTDDPQYQTFYQASSNRIANTQYLFSEQ